jgi:hypothetical protein
MMTLPVVLRDQAAEELLVACDYLEARQAGLSVRLIAEVKRVVNRISAHPELHGLVLQTKWGTGVTFAASQSAPVPDFPRRPSRRRRLTRAEVQSWRGGSAK